MPFWDALAPICFCELENTVNNLYSAPSGCGWWPFIKDLIEISVHIYDATFLEVKLHMSSSAAWTRQFIRSDFCWASSADNCISFECKLVYLHALDPLKLILFSPISFALMPRYINQQLYSLEQEIYIQVIINSHLSNGSPMSCWLSLWHGGSKIAGRQTHWKWWRAPNGRMFEHSASRDNAHLRH